MTADEIILETAAALAGPHPVTVSATSLEKAKTCRRMWWYDAVLRLPRAESTQSQAFGTALHAVVARWLEADDQGRDVTGLPVNLYPMAWDAGLTDYEKDLVKRLVEKAIEQGVLERDPHRHIEARFHGPMPGATNVNVTGFVDVLVADPKNPAVWDHKTTSRADYVKSPSALKADTQMILYAKMLSEHLRETTGTAPPEVRIGHNAFVKDPDDLRVRKVRTTVTAAEIDAKYSELVALAHDLVALRDRGYGPDDWSKVPEAVNSNTCNHYYGKPCDFVTICGGVVSPREFEARMLLRLNQNQTSTNDTTTNPTPAPSTTAPKETTTTMGLSALEQKLAAKAAVNASAGVATPAAVATTINPPAPTVTPVTTTTATAAGPPAAPAVKGAPWGDPACIACRGLGFTSTGKDPCRICAAKAAAKGTIQPSWFEIAYLDGGAIWEPKPEHANKPGVSGGEVKVGGEIKAESKSAPATSTPAAPAPTPAAEAPKRTRRKLDAAPAPAAANQNGAAPTAPAPATTAPAMAPVATTDTTAAAPATTSSATTTEESTRTRRKKGFTLCVRCVPMGVTKFVDLDDVLYTAGKELATAKGVTSYYAIPFFERKDALGHAAEKIAEGFGTGFVVAASGSQDMRELVAVLRPLADVVIEGVGA